VVREYSYLKLLACYGYGPGLGSSIDDDITCYQDCITFTMNYCVPFRKSVRMLGLSRRDCVAKFKKEVKECLLWMHNYHILHRDIKPSNCMYNPTIGKYVLIDFGISQPAEEGYT
jgi:serine/threonine protein kinase